jgi:UDP-glucose 4-epimerase
MKALVTGANGFLGRHVVGALLARGVEVRALVRPAARLEELGWPSSVEIFRADLRTSRELRGAFEGVDVLVHLAAVISGGEDVQFAGTVDGNQCLPPAHSVRHLLGLRFQLNSPDTRRELTAAPSARRV